MLSVYKYNNILSRLYQSCDVFSDTRKFVLVVGSWHDCHQVDVARVLLLAGADSHARDHRSRCPLHMAALAGSEELATSLLACGADPNKASDLGTTALHNAVSLV